MARMRENLLEDDPITLKEASELMLRGIVSVSALRSEIKRGNLTVERIGKNLYTTPSHIRAMRLNAAFRHLDPPPNHFGQANNSHMQGRRQGGLCRRGCDQWNWCPSGT